MYLEKVNKTELRLLNLILDKGLSEKAIASELDRSPSWISECVGHLSNIGFVDIRKEGISNEISISDNDLGWGYKKLREGEPMLGLDAILPDSGLLILPLMLSPGASIKEIVRRTRLSQRTIYYKIRKWMGMGLIDLKEYPNGVILNSSMRHLIEFIEVYNRYRNRQYLSSEVKDGLIIWDGKDEFLFSTGTSVYLDKFRKAGPTRAEELGCNIISRLKYHHFSVVGDEITLEEALAQTVRVDPDNPRSYRLIRDQLNLDNVDKNMIIHYAEKYEIVDRIIERVLNE